MKIISLFIVTYISIVVFFGLSSPSLIWFPLLPTMMLLAFSFHGYRLTLLVAAFGGILYDLHYLYIGPYIVMYLLLGMTIAALSSRYLSTANAWSEWALSFTIYVLYYVGLALIMLINANEVSLDALQLLGQILSYSTVGMAVYKLIAFLLRLLYRGSAYEA